MPVRLEYTQADFETRFEALLGQKREASHDVSSAVRAILDEVRARGDEAVFEYTAKFDRMDLTPDTVRISSDELEKATAEVDAETLAALQLAHDRIKSHHERQMPKDDRYTDQPWC